MTNTTWTLPTPEQMTQWHEATADLRTKTFEAALVKAEAKIRKDRTGKVQPQNVWTKKQEQQARNMAKGAVVTKLHRTKEHNGVRNPGFDDPEFGYGTREQRGESTTDHTPNKYAGKCKCGGWVEAGKGKLVKVNGRFGAEHLGKCPEAKPRPNRYAGSCVKCGQWVEAEQGTITRQVNGAWQTLHIGTCPEKPAEEAPKELGPDDIDLSGLVPGYYAVPGGSRLKLGISTGRKGGRWEGHWFVKDAAEYGLGAKYGMQRPGSGYQGKVKDELRTILSDPKAAMVAYGKLVGVCGACGRKLEDEASVAAGIGPICAQKW